MIQTVSMKDAEFGRKFLESLKDTGFAVVTDHGVNNDLIDGVYEYWKDFYSADPGFKTGFLYNPNDNLQGGYFPFKSENAKDQKISDLKEFYHVYRNSTIPFVPIDILGVLEPRDITLMYPHPALVGKLFQEMENLGVDLLRHINNHLPNDVWNSLSMDLEVMASGSPATLLRSIHYPPIQEDDEKAGAVRAAAHGDINLITLLPAATASGLEVMDSKGNWVKVQDVRDSIVVNVGDMLELATEGYLKSTIHRVVNTTEGRTQSRYSMPLFVHPWPDVRLSPTKTAGQFLDERLKEIGLKK